METYVHYLSFATLINARYAKLSYVEIFGSLSSRVMIAEAKVSIMKVQCNMLVQVMKFYVHCYSHFYHSVKSCNAHYESLVTVEMLTFGVLFKVVFGMPTGRVRSFEIKPKCHWTCTRVNGQTILSCDFTYHLKRSHYDPKLLDNATLANSWSQVEIQ